MSTSYTAVLPVPAAPAGRRRPEVIRHALEVARRVARVTKNAVAGVAQQPAHALPARRLTGAARVVVVDCESLRPAVRSTATCATSGLLRVQRIVLRSGEPVRRFDAPFLRARLHRLRLQPVARSAARARVRSGSGSSPASGLAVDAPLARRRLSARVLPRLTRHNGAPRRSQSSRRQARPASSRSLRACRRTRCACVGRAQ